MRIYLLVVLLLACSLKGNCQPKTDSLLNALHKIIDNKQTYVQEKLDRITSLKKELARPGNSTANTFTIYNKLYHEYKVFIYDSAFKYAKKLTETAYSLKDQSKIGYSRVKTGFILISSGMFKETFDSLNRIDITYLPDSTRVEYFSLLARAYYDLGDYDNDHHYNETYLKFGNRYMDSAMHISKPGTYGYLELSNYKDLKTQNVSDALRDIAELLTKYKLTEHQKAVNYHHLGLVYMLHNDINKALEPFILASISDIKSATKETAAMSSLAEILYKNGDVTNAYFFIKQAMEDADYYGARQRKVQIGSLLPMIASERLNNIDEQRKRWLTYSISLTVLSVITLAFAFIIIRQFRRLKVAELKITEANHQLQETNHRLREADKIKEEYIGYYFNINSEYLDKIDAFRKAVELKIKTKKFEDIKFIITNIDLKRERDELYFSFDKIFLKLFPDFISTFNSYFEEEDRIELKEGQLLNTELRIFALIRMGIHDTDKISKILGYSVNTIYTYKNKVKSKSILPNDEFERKIREIQTV